MTHEDVDTLNKALVEALRQPGYDSKYPSEAAFEQDVWKRVWRLMEEAYGDASNLCLTVPHGDSASLPGRMGCLVAEANSAGNITRRFW